MNIDDDEQTTLSDDLATAWDDLISDDEDENEDDEAERRADSAGDADENHGDADEDGDDEESEESGDDDAEGSDDAEASGEDGRLAAPEHWSEADREQFDALPDEVKPLWLEKSKSLEAGYDSKFKEVADQRALIDRFAPLSDVLAPYQNNLQMRGVSEAQYVQQLVATAAYLEANPVEGIQHLMRQYRLDPKAIAPQASAAEGEFDFTDPELDQVNKRLDGFEQFLRQQQQSAVQQEAVSLQSQIDIFKGATDDKGELLHPHFDKVIPAMQANLLSSDTMTLDEAYKRACRADDAIFVEMVEAAKAETVQSQDAERRKQVDKAKKVKKVPKSRGGNTKPIQQQAATWADELSNTWDALESA